MRLDALKTYIELHQHHVVIQDGELFGCEDFGGKDAPPGMRLAGVWTRLEPTWSAVRAWLGY